MNCEQYIAYIIPYLDQELDEHLANEIRSHLESCEECSSIFFKVKGTYELIEKEKAITVSPQFLDRIMSNLNQEKENKVIQLIPTILRPLAAAASIALGVFIGNGELEVLNSSDTEYIEIVDQVSPVAHQDYSVWATLTEDYGN